MIFTHHWFSVNADGKPIIGVLMDCLIPLPFQQKPNVIKDQQLNPVRIAKIYPNEWLCVSQFDAQTYPWYIDGLVEKRSKSIANALELRLSYTNPSIFILPIIKPQNLSLFDHNISTHYTLWNGINDNCVIYIQEQPLSFVLDNGLHKHDKYCNRCHQLLHALSNL